jgi:predicted RNA-binding protein
MTYDFVRDLLEQMESQGLQYYLVLLDKDPKQVNDKLMIYTTFDKTEINKVVKSMKTADKKTEERKKIE